MSASFERLRDLFDAASELAPSEREAFLAVECRSDPALMDEVRRLLVHDGQPREIFDAPPAIDITGEGSDVGDTLDAIDVPGYEVQRKLGAGGFGVVFAAQQLQPVRRQVALKVIRVGFAAPTVHQRFAIECDALARLEHPSIARVFDAGTTPSGHLFCTMELVDGVTICDYANEHGLSAAERIALMVPVCEAMQHAHQRGILHRDLKPSNILVTDTLGSPVPKIIDFGIAKMRDVDDAEASSPTLSGEFVGTPIYMSPEQADPDLGDVDTRSDVYSLGVVLYELLTGTAPAQSTRTARPSLASVLTSLREHETPLVSKRLRDLGEDGEFHAQRCGTTHDALIRYAVGDLDRMLAMAVEKERSRRYESPQQFGADLERFLRNEPVLAQSPTTSYVLRKFARRHRGKLALAATALVLLVTGATLTTVGFVSEAKQRRRAEGEARISGEIVQFFNDDLLAALAPEAMGIDVTVRETLDAASTKIEGRFDELPDVDVALRTTLGASYRSLGVVEESIHHLKRACDVAEQHLSREDVRRLRAFREYGAALYTAGRYDESETVLRTVLEDSERALGGSHEDTIAAAFHLASACSEDPDPSKSLALVEQWLPVSRAELGPAHVQTLQFSFGLGHIHLAENKPQEALAVFEEAHERSREALGATHRMTLMLTNQLARLRIQLGESSIAEKMFRKAWTESIERLGATHPTTLNLRTGLAEALVADPTHHAEAIEHYDALLAASSTVFRADHPTLHDFWTVIARGYLRTGQATRARALLERVVEATEESSTPKALWAMKHLRQLAEESGDKAGADAWQARHDRAAERLRSAEEHHR
ncbi:MAG: serine/threonine protein kinase [Planctomycetes bacterium]|nr:serine/threonine protein kinase [Planctomycetota bacterium]